MVRLNSALDKPSKKRPRVVQESRQIVITDGMCGRCGHWRKPEPDDTYGRCTVLVHSGTTGRMRMRNVPNNLPGKQPPSLIERARGDVQGLPNAQTGREPQGRIIAVEELDFFDEDWEYLSTAAQFGCSRWVLGEVDQEDEPTQDISHQGSLFEESPNYAA